MPFVIPENSGLRPAKPPAEFGMNGFGNGFGGAGSSNPFGGFGGGGGGGDDTGLIPDNDVDNGGKNAQKT